MTTTLNSSFNDHSRIPGAVTRGATALVSSAYLAISFFTSIAVHRLALLLLPLILLTLWPRSLPKRLTDAAVGCMIGIIVIFAGRFIVDMSAHVANPPEWDFYLFWSYGRASALGQNPYEQANLLTAIDDLNASEVLRGELFFFYAPPTLFLFAPLGWFDIQNALLIWYIFQSLILVGVIWLLWRLFLREYQFSGLLLSAALTLMFGPTFGTMEVGQLNFLLVFFLLLFWRSLSRQSMQTFQWAGLWFALAIFTKPIAVLLGLYLLLRRRWGIILSAVSTMAALSILTILVYGWDMFIGYFLSNPIANEMPAYLYNEQVNQSLLANILRWTNYDLTQHSAYSQPLFLGGATILTLLTAGILITHKEGQEDWLFGLTTAWALLIFPKTLTHYSFLLVIPIFILLKHRQTLPGGWWMVMISTLILYFLVWADLNRYFIANLLTWGIFFGVALWWLVNRRAPSAAPALDPLPSS
jgi:hypothetical protein